MPKNVRGANKNSDYCSACVISMENTKTKHYRLAASPGAFTIYIKHKTLLTFQAFYMPWYTEVHCTFYLLFSSLKVTTPPRGRMEQCMGSQAG